MNCEKTHSQEPFTSSSSLRIPKAPPDSIEGFSTGRFRSGTDRGLSSTTGPDDEPGIARTLMKPKASYWNTVKMGSVR